MESSRILALLWKWRTPCDSYVLSAVGIQFELCGRWYHYSCRSVKAHADERMNWNCDWCRTEKVRMLQEDLQNALRQIDELKARNRESEAK